MTFPHLLDSNVQLKAVLILLATLSAADSRIAIAEGENHEEAPVKLSIDKLKNAGVELATAAGGRIASTLSLPGQIVLNADESAHVVAQFDGTVREVNVALGATIRAGETMAVVDSRELADLSATYLSASKRLELATVTFEREQSLWDQKISAEQDFIAAKHALAEAQIEQRQTKQKLKAYGIDEASLGRLGGDGNLARFTIRAPIAGTVIDKKIKRGETVAADDKLFEIADLSTVWLDISVFPKDLAQIAIGQMVRVTASGVSEPTTGTISYIQPLTNTGSRTVLARAVLKNPDGQWRPGLFATATAVTAEADAALTVPKEALQSYEGNQVVFVDTNDGLVPRPVTTGRTDGASVEVLGGLQAGERYVAKNSFIVKSELSKGEAAHED